MVEEGLCIFSSPSPVPSFHDLLESPEWNNEDPARNQSVSSAGLKLIDCSSGLWWRLTLSRNIFCSVAFWCLLCMWVYLFPDLCKGSRWFCLYILGPADKSSSVLESLSSWKQHYMWSGVWAKRGKLTCGPTRDKDLVKLGRPLIVPPDWRISPLLVGLSFCLASLSGKTLCCWSLGWVLGNEWAHCSSDTCFWLIWPVWLPMFPIISKTAVDRLRHIL